MNTDAREEDKSKIKFAYANLGEGNRLCEYNTFTNTKRDNVGLKQDQITKVKSDEKQLKQGQIIYVDLGEGEGSEQGGVRPCIIIQNDTGNKFSTTTLVAPITKEIKIGKNGKIQPTHYIIENYKEVGLPTKSMILFEQIRCISKKRIIKKKGLGKIDLEQIKNNILTSFGM